MLGIGKRDRWFIDRVLPHAAAYHRQARRWAVDAEAARDIVQDAYARMIALPNWASLIAPKAYMLLIVRNVAIDRLRQAQVLPFERADTAVLFDLADDAPDAFDHAAAQNELARVKAAVETLPPQCRRVLEMRKFEDKSPGEIAETLGISVSTVETHLAKGVRLVMKAVRPVADEESERIARDEQSRHFSGGGSGLVGQTGRRNG